MTRKKLKRQRLLARLLSLACWTSTVVLAMISDSGELLSFKELVMYEVFAVLGGLVFAVVSAELTEKIKGESLRIERRKKNAA